MSQHRETPPAAPPPPISAQPMRIIDLLAAFGTGCLLTLMVLLNSDLAHHTTPLFSSLAAHGTGTVAAALALLLLARHAVPAPSTLGPAPLWAYAGGISGAVTVLLTSITVNTALALSGTLALGLAGQVVFGLIADRFGLFGMAKRSPGARDLAALGLIIAGSLLIIFLGGAA